MNKESGFMHTLESIGGVFSHRRKPRYVYLCAFFLPFLVMFLLWAIHAVAPFGTKMILAHDQWHQYYPFYLDLRSRILSGQSLFHSWTTGMGTSYLPLFAYYLASPLNYLAAILPESLAMYYYTFTVLLRIGLAGLFFAFFLKKTFDRSELMISVFSTMYALCAFIMGYYWNAIWLDTIALLPLVVLGTLSLLQDRRYVLYTFSLFLSVFCSYYIGLFTCVFVLLLFIGWHIVNWDSLGGFFSRFFRIALFTLMAIGMTAVLTIPAFLGLQATSSAVNKFPDANAMNMVENESIPAEEALELITRGELSEFWDFFDAKPPVYAEDKEFTVKWSGLGDAFDALAHLRIGDFFSSLAPPLKGFGIALSNTGTLIDPTTMEGLPNLFCGFSTLLLAMLFLFCRQVPLRQRLYTVFLLLFFLASFVHRPLDYLWHGMHFPNMLPYRFSFLWSFTIVYMAYRVWTELEHIRWWRIAIMTPVAILLTWCVAAGQGSARVGVATILIAVFTMELLFLFCFRKIRREHLALGLTVFMLFEIIAGAALGVHKVNVTDSAYYPTQGESTKILVEKMNKREADTVDLWRAEVALKQSLNDGTLNGYNGISVFSSAANCNVSRFLQSIGLAASVAGNRYSYQEADPFTNLLLGLKYLIDRNGRNVNPDYFRQVDSDNNVVLLENKAYLPLGLVVRNETLEFDGTEVNGLPYGRLNTLFSLMTGMEETLYDEFIPQSIEALGIAETTFKASTSFGAKCDSADDDNCVEATFVMPKDGLLCVYSKSTNTSDVVWFLNGERQYTYSDKYGYNRCMGSFRKGDRVALRFRPQANKTANVTIGGAVFDTALFDRAYEFLSERTMLTTEVSDTSVKGVVRVYEPSLVYTSIPNDSGWTLAIDDQEAKITPLGEAFIAFHVEPGVHRVELKYEAPGFSLGLKISLICLAGFLVLLILALLARFTRPPIVKMQMDLADPRLEVPQMPEPAEPRQSEAGDSPGGSSMPPLIPAQNVTPAAPVLPRPLGAEEAEPSEDPPADLPAAEPGAEFPGELLPSGPANPEPEDAPASPNADPPQASTGMSDFPTGTFTPVSVGSGPLQKPIASAAATGIIAPDGTESSSEEPPAEIYTIEELDRLLHGDPPEEN